MPKAIRVNEQIWLKGNIIPIGTYVNPPQHLVEFAEESVGSENAIVVHFVEVSESQLESITAQPQGSASKKWSFISIEEYKALRAAEQVDYIATIESTPDGLSDAEADDYDADLFGFLTAVSSEDVSKKDAQRKAEEILSAFGANQ